MSYKKLNFLSNLYFYLILFTGLSYFVFLFFSFAKIFPGFAMQIIFLLDSLKFDNNIFILIMSKMFLINVIPGLLLFGLIFQLFKSIIKLITNVWQTNQLVNSLNIVKSTSLYDEFKSKQSSIFTLGFFRPQIFISSSIFKTHNQFEINSMIQHEINHQKNLHPLKIFVSNFIKSIIPTIPCKNWLFDSYLTSTEVSSDLYSQNQVNSKIHLVSALLKFQGQHLNFLPASISYFNSQSERIKMLIGQKKLTQNVPMVYSSLIMVLIMVSAFSIKNSNLFYECQHLVKCVQTLITPNSKSLTSPISSIKNSSLISDHCQ